MKISAIISVLIVGCLILSFNNPESLTNQQGIIISECDSIPELNKQIIDFVKTNIKKKVGKGECWDLAAGALNSIGAKWNGQYVFGTEVLYKTECVYPGDIIQFKNVRVQYEVNGKVYIEMMEQHTAVIYEVKNKGSYILAHQNTPFSGKKVGLSPINLKDINKGKITIYRPEK
jgi:hypothetical protein